MTRKFDIKAFHASIREDAELTASRVSNDAGLTRYQRLCVSAQVMGVLLSMRNHAEHKPLSRQDVQEAINAFFDKMGLAEEYSGMGALSYNFADNPFSKEELKRLDNVTSPPPALHEAAAAVVADIDSMLVLRLSKSAQARLEALRSLL